MLLTKQKWMYLFILLYFSIYLSNTKKKKRERKFEMIYHSFRFAFIFSLLFYFSLKVQTMLKYKKVDFFEIQMKCNTSLKIHHKI